MTTSSKTQRLLDMVAYLVDRRFPVSVDELMAAVPAYGERWRDYTVDGVSEPGYRITRRGTARARGAGPVKPRDAVERARR